MHEQDRAITKISKQTYLLLATFRKKIKATGQKLHDPIHTEYPNQQTDKDSNFSFKHFPRLKRPKTI